MHNHYFFELIREKQVLCQKNAARMGGDVNLVLNLVLTMKIAEISNLPALAVFLMKQGVAFLAVVEAEGLGIPLQLEAGDPGGHAAQQDRFAERSGVVEAGSGLARPPDGLYPLLVVIGGGQDPEVDPLEFFLRVETWEIA